MAQKRMFDKRITDSDKFMDLPNSTKALYFMAGMNADDRGFFQPRRLQRECGFTDDDYKILIAKNYFKTFESGVMVITDWNKNNYLDTNRLTETEYVNELKMLEVINGRYELTADTVMLNQCLTDVKPTFNQYSIEENSIEKNSIDKKTKRTKVDDVIDIYSRECPTLPQIRTVTDKRKKAITTFLKTYTLEDWEEVCKITNGSDFLLRKNKRLESRF